MRRWALLLTENVLLWGAYHLLMWARMADLAELVARRCVQRHGLPGDYLDLVTALHARGKDDEARSWPEVFDSAFPRLRRFSRTDRLRRRLAGGVKRWHPGS